MRGRRWLAIVGAALFLVSTAFPIVASMLLRDQPPTWVGLTDAAIAFLTVGICMYLDYLGRKSVTEPIVHASYRVYRLVAGLFLVLIVVYFVVGQGIDWTVLLIGLGWRAWLLFYVFPSWLAVLRSASR